MRNGELEKLHYIRRRQPRTAICSYFVMCLVDECNLSLWYSNIVLPIKGGLKTVGSDYTQKLCLTLPITYKHFISNQVLNCKLLKSNYKLGVTFS